MNKVTDMSAAILLVGTSATAVPLGPLRLSDVSAVALLLLSLTMLKSKNVNNNNRAILALFCMLIISMTASVFMQFIFSQNLLDFTQINGAASVHIAVIVALIFSLSRSTGSILYITNLYAILMLASNFLLLLYTTFVGSPSWILVQDLTTDRFSGFAQNPNQLALYILPIPFFALVRFSNRQSSFKVTSAIIFLTVALNATVFGKGLFVAWLSSLLILCIFGTKSEFRIRKITLRIVLVVFLSPFVYFLLAPTIGALYSGDARGSVDGQGADRILLWLNGARAWLDAPFFGHGTGHYSGYFGPYESIEAHNFFIDWLSAYGIVGTALLGWIFLYFLYDAVKKKSWIVVALYATITLQSLFHFYGRQPVFWLWWLFGFYLTTVKWKADGSRQT